MAYRDTRWWLAGGRCHIGRRPRSIPPPLSGDSRRCHTASLPRYSPRFSCRVYANHLILTSVQKQGATCANESVGLQRVFNRLPQNRTHSETPGSRTGERPLTLALKPDEDLQFDGEWIRRSCRHASG